MNQQLQGRHEPSPVLKTRFSQKSHFAIDKAKHTGVDEVGLRVQQDPQRPHIIVEILEHGRALAQDAVSRENGVLLLQQQGHVVIGVARSGQHSEGRERCAAFTSWFKPLMYLLLVHKED